jgi:glycosyltransferase involved in cell wall biosynthesis
MKEGIRASIIIPTYNGSQKLSRILDALLAQSIRDFEVVVVIDGSTDHTLEIAEGYAPLFKSFEIIVQDNKGRAGARNKGVREAQADLIVFYDDDMVPAKDSVERHVHFHRDKKNAVLTGCTPQAMEAGSNDFTLYRAFLSERWTRHLMNSRTPLDEQNLFLTAANCSLEKATFTKVGGFDETRSDGEDKDLAKRAFKQKVDLYFDSENIAHHQELINCRSYIARLRQYALAEKKIRSVDNRFGSNVSVTMFRRFWYFILASALPVRIIDSFNVFIVMPRWIRYKFYDAILFSLSEVYPEVRI